MKSMKVRLFFLLVLVLFAFQSVSAADRKAVNSELARIVTEDLIPVKLDKIGSYTVNFELIMNYAVMCQMMNYNPDAELQEIYRNIRFIDLPKYKNRMMIIDDAGFDENNQGIQTIVFRGSGHPRNFLVDLNFRPSRSDKLNCRIHRGFLKSVGEIDAIATGLLDKKRKVRIAGSSLGGALAVVYGMFLKKQGFDIDLIITFGQPRVTDKKGRAIWGNLPLVRVVNRTDAFPAIPPYQPFGYSHFGRMILLHDDYYYSIYDEKIVEKLKPEGKVANFVYKVKNKDISIPNHFINLVAARLELYVKRKPIYWLYNLGILPEDADKGE
ncbi:MAG: hypothetical protein CVV41_22460 [Candidatus Riflebacteria bacterium HGW-Riflebacteria-1]|nr:MAG: hypothetical protein CVV41_22460 [Candidatus Riflebacteria bacterium HGW-Riflebacteria-1]